MILTIWRWWRWYDGGGRSCITLLSAIKITKSHNLFLRKLVLLYVEFIRIGRILYERHVAAWTLLLNWCRNHTEASWSWVPSFSLLHLFFNWVSTNSWELSKCDPKLTLTGWEMLKEYLIFTNSKNLYAKNEALWESSSLHPPMIKSLSGKLVLV